MACLAIKHDLKDCRNYAVGDTNLCYIHKNLCISEMTARWKRKNFHGFNTSRLLLPSKKQKRARILTPIGLGLVKINENDLRKMPITERLVDLYIVLCEYLHLELDVNMTYKMHCFRIFLRIIEFYNHRRPNYLESVFSEHLVLKSVRHFKTFLKVIAEFSKNPHSMTNRPHFFEYMMSIMETDTVKEFSWNHEAQHEFKKSIHELKCLPSFIEFIESRWLPDIQELYRAEKQIQKLKISHIKEQLMMVCWHPIRVEKWLTTGGWELLEMMIGQ